jgi:hypothetical protein
LDDAARIEREGLAVIEVIGFEQLDGHRHTMPAFRPPLRESQAALERLSSCIPACAFFEGVCDIEVEPLPAP